MIKILQSERIQLLMTVLLSLIGLGSVFLVNASLGYDPSLLKALRNFCMVLILLPFCLILRMLKYRGTFRILIIANVLMIIGLTLRYDYEIKRDYNRAMQQDVFITETETLSQTVSRADVIAISKIILAYSLCLAIFLLFRINPAMLLRRYMLLSILAILILAGYKVLIILTGEHFVFKTTPWDFVTPMFVMILTAFLTENRAGLADLQRGFLPRAVYWVPLLIIWAVPAGMFVIIREFGIFMVLGLFLILMLYLSTKRLAYILLSGGMIFLFGWIVIHFDLVGGHVGTRLSIWSDFWKGYPESIPPGQILIENRDFLNWIGKPNLRGQHLSGFFAIWHGGFTGVGLGVGYPNAVPLATTDFLATGIGESLGLSGILIVTGLILSYGYHCFRLAIKINSKFLSLSLQGFAILLISQYFVSIAGPLSILPMTGVPIPFAARSNTLMIATFMVIGYIMAIEDLTFKEQK